MKRLAALLPLALSACSMTAYWGSNMIAMSRDPELPSVPLARSVEWTHQVTMGDSAPDIYSGTLGFSDDRPVDPSKEAPARKLTSGLGWIEANLMVAREAPGWDDEEGQRLITEADAALALARTLQPAHEDTTKPERTYQGVVRDAETLGNVAAWGLGNYVSRDAPEGSRLFVSMDSASTSTPFGWTWQHRVTVMLRRGDREILSRRATPWHIYTSPPQQPPPDTVRAADVLQGRKLPYWLAQYYDLGVLVRSAANEIAHGQRLYNAAVERATPRP